MRRTLAAGAAVLVCLALSGMPALAQDASEEPAAEMVVVTGTETCGTRTPFAPSETPNGVLSVRDAATTCHNVMSDPRLSGPWLNTMDMDCYGDEFCTYRGTHVLDGPDGGWDCSWTASDFPVAHEGILIIGICPGTGGYEGLTYVFQHTSEAFEDGTSFHGVIYEGPPLG